ncbi:MAG TPA: hypothetical protein VFU38_04670, partial [Candidatus Krumholzibacteria bacterium]|nr:hypothetical protein [Candidatus Krumholzibacteria bacterium]
MGLRDRFNQTARSPEPLEYEQRRRANGNSDSVATSERPSGPALNDRSNGLKARIHRRMVERINLASLETVEPERLRGQIRQIIAALLAEENIPLSEA